MAHHEAKGRSARQACRSTPIRAIALVVLAVLARPAYASAERLPLTAFPEHYDLRFAPHLDRETFDGEARIRVRLLRPTTRIVLHAAELEITSSKIIVGQRVYNADPRLAPESETVVLALPTEIGPGVAELQLGFSGILNRQLRGFYISEANGRKYAVTQLEATDARRMFPSFDEPQFKATFAISVVIDAADYAISNGAIESFQPGPLPGTQLIRFGTTAKMPTYLVALAVGDFKCASETASGIPLRVCATPDKLPLARFALEATRHLLRYFNDYFSTDYPFAKLDQVAIPDFAAGAMENTGAIFYRESILLVDPDTATLEARRRAAAVIAHEIAHHWFGNLVTMTWWNDLWLNEGFATWMEAKALAAWRPDWPVREDEVQSVQSAMAIDALGSTRPIRVRAETPGEINELFDPIAYEKSAAVLRMVETYAGEELFRGGVNAYLETHAYGNATAEDFWRMVTRATGKPIDRVLSSFVDQPGLPIVAVSTSCADGKATVTLRQQRYRQDDVEPAAAMAPWSIPVCLRSPHDGEADARCELLDQPERTLTLGRCVPWMVGNAEARGYYRTSYSDAMARALAGSGALHPPEAIMLLADEWAMVRAGRHPVGRFLDVTGSVVRGTAAAGAAESAAARLNYVHEYLTTPRNRDGYEDWVRRVVAPTLARAGDTDNPGSPVESERLQSALMLALGVAGRDPSILARARGRIDAYLVGKESIPAALLDTLVSLAALEGDAALYEAYLERSRTAATPEQRYRFLYALAAFRNRALLQRTIEYAMSDRVRTQDRPRLLAAVLDNPAGRNAAWAAIRADWPRLEATLAGFNGTGRIIEGLDAFCDGQRAAEIAEFFKSQAPAGATRTLAQTLERIRSCAALVAAEQPHLDLWLVKQAPVRQNASSIVSIRKTSGTSTP